LNDLTNGATSKALFGEPTPTADGTEWTQLYHAHDYEQRVADYAQNMRAASRITAMLKSDMLVVLQPALFESQHRTEIEETLLKRSLQPHASKAALLSSYEAMRRELGNLARSPGVHYLDCSRVLAEERHTTFADLWHFSDPGHAILGRAIAEKISAIVRERK